MSTLDVLVAIAVVLCLMCVAGTDGVRDVFEHARRMLANDVDESEL